MARKKHAADLLNQQQIIKQYNISKAIIRQYFPKPQVKTVRSRSGAYWSIGVWPKEQVEELVKKKEIRRFIEDRLSKEE